MRLLKNMRVISMCTCAYRIADWNGMRLLFSSVALRARLEDDFSTSIQSLCESWVMEFDVQL